jgi:hypothetical protein
LTGERTDEQQARAVRASVEAYVRAWNSNDPAEIAFRWHPLAVTPWGAIVQGETTYRDPPRTYSNLWVIRLDGEGRCTEFTEWWMRHPDAGEPAAGDPGGVTAG